MTSTVTDGRVATVYLSELLGAPVRDVSGRAVGRVADLIAPADTDYPAIAGLAVKTGGGVRTVPWSAVRAIEARTVVLAGTVEDVAQAPGGTPTLSLARQVLDRQLIDINGVRVVRANDVQLAWFDGHLHVVGIDVSNAGLLRRLGVASVLATLGMRAAPSAIPWGHVEPVESGAAGVKLRVSRDDLARLRPADLAQILSQLDQAHASEVLVQLDDETAADALGELHEDLQVSLIRGMEPERAADILEEMDPDEAADLLGDLAEDEPERAEDLLGRMEPDEAADVRELLAYGDDCAGGLMTTDVVTIPADVSAARAIELVRDQARELGSVYYVYAVDSAERVVGVLSLRELIVAEPEVPIREAMHTDLVVAHAEDAAEDVARRIAKYDLLALPVVDAEGRLEGIVTVDDAIDVILPESWTARLPRVFRRA